MDQFEEFKNNYNSGEKNTLKIIINQEELSEPKVEESSVLKCQVNKDLQEDKNLNKMLGKKIYPKKKLSKKYKTYSAEMKKQIIDEVINNILKYIYSNN